MRAQLRPRLSGIVGAVEDGDEERLAEFGHARLDTAGDAPGRMFGKLQVIFEIPAQIGAVLFRQSEGEFDTGRHQRPVLDLRRDLDPVAAGSAARMLGDT